MATDIEVEVLDELREVGPTTIAAVARGRGLTVDATLGALRRLEHRGAVRRQTAPARRGPAIYELVGGD